MKVKGQRSITPKQKKVLEFIRSFIDKNDYSPSLQEIAKHFKKSISTAQHYVDILTGKGFLSKEDNVSRSIKPVGKASQVLLLGEIAAGEPIEPIEIPEPIDIPASMINSPGNYYALKVRGDSMIEDGIMDGDMIVVKHQKIAESGEIVVAVTEKGATLKIFKKKNGKILLEPRNKNLKNIYPKELEIRGRFVGLVRNS